MSALLAWILMQTADVRLQWSEYLGGAEGAALLDSVVYEYYTTRPVAIWFSAGELGAVTGDWDAFRGCELAALNWGE